MVSKREFQNFKDDSKENMAIKDDLKGVASKDVIKYMMKELTISLLILNLFLQEEDKDNKSIESQSHMENISTRLENKRMES
jgi:hypothetical protein